MPPEPRIKRTIAFIDGQNLYHAARKTFGYTYPNYDVDALARAVFVIGLGDSRVEADLLEPPALNASRPRQPA